MPAPSGSNSGTGWEKAGVVAVPQTHPFPSDPRNTEGKVSPAQQPWDPAAGRAALPSQPRASDQQPQQGSDPCSHLTRTKTTRAIRQLCAPKHCSSPSHPRQSLGSGSRAQELLQCPYYTNDVFCPNHPRCGSLLQNRSSQESLPDPFRLGPVP